MFDNLRPSDIWFLLANVSSLAPVIVGLIFFKRLGIDRKILLGLFIYCAIVEFTNAWMFLHRQRTWMYHVFILFEFGVFTYVLAKWSRSKVMRGLAIVGSIVFYSLWCTFYFSHKITARHAPIELAESIVLLMLGLYIITSASIASERPVLKSYRFWFAAVIFIYFASNLLFTYLLEKIFSASGLSYGLWNVHSVVQILVYLLFAYAFYLKEE